MYKTSLNIGTLAGIIAFLIFLVMYFIGLSPLGMGKFFGFWVPVAAIFWGTIRIRKEVLGGSITFSQAFGAGLLTMLVWCTFKGFCMYIFMTAFENHVIEQYMDFIRWYFEMASKTGNDDLIKQLDMNEITTAATPWNLMLGDISNNILYGGFIALVSAFILKRNPKQGTV
jgi:hypothetical protein